MNIAINIYAPHPSVGKAGVGTYRKVGFPLQSTETETRVVLLT